MIFVRTLGNRKGDLYMVNTKTKRVVRLTKTAAHEGSPVCSADGKWVYYVVEGAQAGVYAGSDPVDFSREIFIHDLTQAGAAPKQVTFGDFKFLNSGPKFSPSSVRQKTVSIWFSPTKILDDGVEHVVVRATSKQAYGERKIAGDPEDEEFDEEDWEDMEDGELGPDDD